MSVRLNCPSCNTAFDLGAVPESRRATCPRCGDVFPVRGDFAETVEPTPLLPNTKHETPNTKRRLWPLWKVVTVVLVLGLGGFALGLYFRDRRSKPSPEPPQPEAPASVVATPPAQLVGLGYLSPECNVVFAVQPGPVLGYAARTGENPRDVYGPASIPGVVLDALEAAGVPPAQIDHLSGGLFVPSGPEDLRAALALVLKQPLADEDAFLKRVKAKPVAGAKTRFDVQLDKIAIGFRLARVSPTVWVFGLNAADLAAADNGGFGPGGAQFRGNENEGFRKMLAAVPPTAAVWTAVDDEREWADKPALKLLQRAELKKYLPASAGVRGAVFALSFGEQPRMRIFIRTAETPAAERLRAYFTARATEIEGATAGGGGVFALFDAPPGAALLERLLADAVK